jgi:hypothetical protein
VRDITERATSRNGHLKPPARHDRGPNRRGAFARSIYQGELRRYHRPQALSRGDQLSFMRRTVTRWDI